jgi:hypothetical protein
MSGVEKLTDTAPARAGRIYEYTPLALLWQIVDFAAIYRIPESIFQ